MIPSWVSWPGLLEHLLAGAGITLLVYALCLAVHHMFDPLCPVLVALAVGIVHEWMDGDLLTSPGHPWNGLLDLGAFLPVPILALVVVR